MRLPPASTLLATGQHATIEPGYHANSTQPVAPSLNKTPFLRSPHDQEERFLPPSSSSSWERPSVPNIANDALPTSGSSYRASPFSRDTPVLPESSRHWSSHRFADQAPQSSRKRFLPESRTSPYESDNYSPPRMCSTQPSSDTPFVDLPHSSSSRDGYLSIDRLSMAHRRSESVSRAESPSQTSLTPFTPLDSSSSSSSPFFKDPTFGPAHSQISLSPKQLPHRHPSAHVLGPSTSTFSEQNRRSPPNVSFRRPMPVGLPSSHPDWPQSSYDSIAPPPNHHHHPTQPPSIPPRSNRKLSFGQMPTEMRSRMPTTHQHESIRHYPVATGSHPSVPHSLDTLSSLQHEKQQQFQRHPLYQHHQHQHQQLQLQQHHHHQHHHHQQQQEQEQQQQQYQQQQQQKKRLRISRACDECRRRKTRCDVIGAFPGEAGHPVTIAGLVPPIDPHSEPQGEMLIIQPCINCRRSGVTCSYSKRPLKRGPSKGYIKDLERRLNSLESQMTQSETVATQDGKREKGKVRTEDRIVRLEHVLANSSSLEQPKSPSAIQGFNDNNPSEPQEMDNDDDSRVKTDNDTDLEVDSLQSPPPPPPPFSPQQPFDLLQPKQSMNRTSSDIALQESKSPLPNDSSQQPYLSVQKKGSSSPEQPPCPQRADHPPVKEKTETTSQHFKPSGFGSAHCGHALNGTHTVSPLARPTSCSISMLVSDAKEQVENDSMHAKQSVLNSFLHATFPVLPYRQSNDTISRLEDRVLTRGFKLLLDPIEPVWRKSSSSLPSSTSSSAASSLQSSPLLSSSTLPFSSSKKRKSKDTSGSSSRKSSKTHSARAAQLVGQACAGFSSTCDELAAFSEGRSGLDRVRAITKVTNRLAGQESDLLMLCYLDSLRHGLVNNSALASAISKLGTVTSACRDSCTDNLRRRTILFMLDRWHSVAFNTPHLLSGYFSPERYSFAEMKQALGPMDQSPLGEQVFEVLRTAIMFGKLNDMAQSLGNWKQITKSDVDSIIYSVGSSSDDDEQSTMRSSLEAAVRTYHTLRTLPTSKQATIQDIETLFKLTLKIQNSILFQSAIGPHVTSLVAIAFSWILSLHSINLLYRDKIRDSLFGLKNIFSNLQHPVSLHLHLVLYFHQTLNDSNQFSDSLLEMSHQLGFLGYIVSSTHLKHAGFLFPNLF